MLGSVFPRCYYTSFYHGKQSFPALPASALWYNREVTPRTAEENESSTTNDMKEVKRELASLRKQIRYHNNRYYNEDKPEISDYE